MNDKAFKDGDYIVDPDTGCHLWQGTTCNGYGQVRLANRTQVAHRYAYEQLVGRIPPRHLIHHTCERKNCINVEHLEPVTAAEHGKIHKGCNWKVPWKHCRWGHEFTVSNTYICKDGSRLCKACKKRRAGIFAGENKYPIVLYHTRCE